MHPNIVCREHLSDTSGRSWTEEHHPPGQHNDPSTTAPIPANDHGVINELQGLWPPDTLRNPHGSPLLRAAAWLRAWLRAWLTILRVIIERTVGRIPAALEDLDRLLTDHIGPGWWESIGWQW